MAGQMPPNLDRANEMDRSFQAALDGPVDGLVEAATSVNANCTLHPYDQFGLDLNAVGFSLVHPLLSQPPMSLVPAVEESPNGPSTLTWPRPMADRSTTDLSRDTSRRSSMPPAPLKGPDLTRIMRRVNTTAGSPPAMISAQTQTTDSDESAMKSASGSTKRKATKEPPVPRKRYRAKGPTRLRKGRAIASEVPMDVWVMILSYCPAQFLARARRINSSFRAALEYESAWRKNRIQNYGPDMPGPFPGMKEAEYANLVDGLGCMNCFNPKTRKTYWVWRKRWCIECFEKCTVREDSAFKIYPDEPRLFVDTVPYGLVDSWGRYEKAGFYDRPSNRQGHGQYRVYGKTDIAALIEEMERFRTVDERGRQGFDREALNDWFVEKKKARDALMKHSQAIEHWDEQRSIDKRSANADLKAERARFFQARARELDPPMEPEALELMQAYKRAIEIARAPTMRSWKMLLPKVEEGRAAARLVLEERHRRAEKARCERDEQIDYSRRRDRRRFQSAPEQLIVDMLADDVVARLARSSPPVADGDFALLALHGIRRKYYEMAATFAVAHQRPLRYRLLLEDARVAFDKHIAPWIDKWHPSRSGPAKMFKCPGCTRNDSQLRHGFDGLFNHLRCRHAAALGDFSYLFREGLGFIERVRWLDIEWPATLPALAEHHAATGRWDPRHETAYVRYVPETQTGTASAFDGRDVSRDDGPETADIVENIIYAGKLFDKTPLDGFFATSIAMRYAIDKCRAVREDPEYTPPVADILPLPVALVRAELFNIFERSRCALCLRSDGLAAREINKVHTAGTLIPHFQMRHGPTKDWSKDMMELPDERELWRVLNEPTMKPALEVFEKLFPRRDGATDEATGGADFSPVAHHETPQPMDLDEPDTWAASPGALSWAFSSASPMERSVSVESHNNNNNNNNAASPTNNTPAPAAGPSKPPFTLSSRGRKAAFKRPSTKTTQDAPAQELVYQRKFNKTKRWRIILDDLFAELVDMQDEKASNHRDH